MSEWVRGADISSLPELEYHGGVLRRDGEPVDSLSLLKAEGLNAVRIKVWNDPGHPDHFPANQTGPQAFNGPAQVLALARRAQAAGLQIMLDFHYSDWWADPGKQTMPVAWRNLDAAAVSEKLYAFTRDVMQQLKEAGVTKLPNLYVLKTEYKKLDAERERLSAQYSEAKQKLKEYGIVKQNVDSILRTAPGKEHTQER